MIKTSDKAEMFYFYRPINATQITSSITSEGYPNKLETRFQSHHCILKKNICNTTIGPNQEASRFFRNHSPHFARSSAMESRKRPSASGVSESKSPQESWLKTTSWEKTSFAYNGFLLNSAEKVRKATSSSILKSLPRPLRLYLWTDLHGFEPGCQENQQPDLAVTIRETHKHHKPNVAIAFSPKVPF